MTNSSYFFPERKASDSMLRVNNIIWSLRYCTGEIISDLLSRFIAIRVVLNLIHVTNSVISNLQVTLCTRTRADVTQINLGRLVQ